MFLTPDADLPATTCRVTYDISNVANGAFRATISVTNTSNQTIVGWALRHQHAQGQTVTASNSPISQTGSNGRDIALGSAITNRILPPGATAPGIAYNATWDNQVSAQPPNFTLNNRRCAVVLP